LDDVFLSISGAALRRGDGDVTGDRLGDGGTFG
jgi:hypothetical protein